MPKDLISPLPIRLQGELDLSPTQNRREYDCRLIRAGQIRRADDSPGPYQIPAAPIQEAIAAGRFDSRAAFVDHAGWFDTPSLRNLAGLTIGTRWNSTDQAADATIRLYDNPAGNIVAALFDQVIDDARNGEPIPDIGLSLVFYPRWEPRSDGTPDNADGASADDPLVLAEFRHIESVDFVFQPAADGRVKDAVADALTALSALQPHVIPNGREESLGPGQLLELATTSPNPPLPKGQALPEGQATRPEDARSLSRTTTEGGSTNMATKDAQTVGAHCDAPISEAPQPQAAGAPPNAQLSELGTDWLTASIAATTEAIIQGSGLPLNVQAHLRGRAYENPDELRAAIELQREILADLHADRVVQIGGQAPRSSGISLGRTPTEQVEAAFEALMRGVAPPSGIAPLTGIREMYHLLSGDYDMHGIFHGDRIQLANVTSATMANVTANVLNKVVINAFMQYPHWWAPIVSEQDFTTLQQVKWITLGGVGELPTVAEGAAYTELTWDDQAETANFVKKGGYLGITLEAIDKDDTRRLRAAPQALAQSAWLTLGKAVSAIFTDNSGTGPTMSDSNALFDAGNHANLLTTALSHAQWIVVRTAMMKQTEINSGERLGFLTAPKYCMVPVDLEMTALVMFASEGLPGGANNDENLFAEGNVHSARVASARDRVIVNPIWTDTNNWAAIADPMLYPSIGIGFRYGRTPEIFSVASPTAGLMFTNDTLPVKVRFFFAVGPTDWRGLHKSNVA